MSDASKAPEAAAPVSTGATAEPAQDASVDASKASAEAPKPAPRKFVRATAPSAPVEAPSASAKSTPAPEKGSRILARLRSQIDADRALVEEAKGYREELSQYAKSALDNIPKEARAYVEKIAGDNHAKLLATLRDLKAAGLLGQTSPSAPANTAPKASAPSGAKPGDDDSSVLAEYERLRKVAPVIALDYATRNSAALQRARTRN
jgi:hypothetical protein